MNNIAIFASHNGSSIDAIQNAIATKKLNLNIKLILSNNTNANVLKKADVYGIKKHIVNSTTTEDIDKKIISLLEEHNCKYIFLAGYMKMINPLLTQKFIIINSHPSLLPKYGGEGMYGRLVHEAVIRNKEQISGVTIHEVNEEYDSGKILLQEEIRLDKDETVETLEAKIKELESRTIVKALTNIFI